MNNKEILQKAIEKAVENGWVWYKADDVGVIMSSFTNIEDDLCREMFYEVIFSHDFAKAFFKSDDVRGKTQYTEPTFYDSGLGVEPMCLTCGKRFTRDDIDEIRFGHKNCPKAIDDGWQMNLQQMVLEKEPLKYIERYL